MVSEERQGDTATRRHGNEDPYSPRRPVTTPLRRIPYATLPVLLCLACFLTLVWLQRAHPFGTYGTETDFYHFYAPDADRLTTGQFPENPFQGPGYPALLALVTRLTGDVFVAGKWISIFSATFASFLVFQIFAKSFSFQVGIGAQLLVMVSGELPQFAISATTDLFFLLLCLATLATFLSERIPLRLRVGLTAVLTALVYLTRYNGLFLMATCLLSLLLLNLFEQSWQQRWRLAGLFVLIFVITASPWFYANWQHHGSPLYNANYLNIATEFYPELAAGEVGQDGTRPLARQFQSFGDVLRYDPMRLLKHYPINLYESLRASLFGGLVNVWTGMLVLPGLVLLWLERRSKARLTILSAGLIYFGLMSLNHWEARYYFFIAVLYAGLAVYAIVRLPELVQQRGWLPQRGCSLLYATLLLLLVTVSLLQSRTIMKEFLASHPQEIPLARDYLRGLNAPPHSLKIVARKPHLPYLTQQDWVFIPQVESVDELRAWLQSHPVDYVLISSRELKERKSLRPLRDPQVAAEWLKVVWMNKEPFGILYQPLAGKP